MARSIEVLCSWESTASLEEDWNRLAAEKGIWSSFTNYHWFACWYDAFCPQGAARIVVIREHGEVVGIITGLHVRKSIGPFMLSCFTYAANGLTPNTVLMLDERLMQEEGLLQEVLASMPEQADMLDVPSVAVDGAEWRLLNRQGQRFWLFEENRYTSYSVDMPEGLQRYLDGRPARFRKEFRHRFNKVSKEFEIGFEVIPFGSEGGLERLKSLSGRTWQEANGSGLFSKKYARFFQRLLSEPIDNCYLAFLLLNGVDAAFALFQSDGDTLISYKIGFDSGYKAWSPGELLRRRIYETSSEAGVRRYLLLGGFTETKKAWATDTEEMVNYWIFSNRGCKARFVYQALNARRKLKALYEARS